MTIYLESEQEIEQEDGVVLTNQTSTTTMISRDQWNELNFTELLDQKNILYDRWEYLTRSGNLLAKEFAVFLTDIDTLIQTKLG